jgi:hypothetical protein
MRFDRLSKGLLAAVGLLCLPALLLADADREGRREKEKLEAEKAEKDARPQLGGHDAEHEDYHRKLAIEGEKNLQEIRRLLDEIQKNLSGKQTGAPTQERQASVVKRMDELIDKLNQECGKCQGSGSGSKSNSQSSQQKPQSEEERKRQEAEARKNQKDVRSPQQEQQKEQQQEEPDNPGKVDNTRVADDKNPDAKNPNLPENLRKGARWGFLPPKLREEMLSATGKEAPAEYRQMVEKYYKRMSDYYEQRGKR